MAERKSEAEIPPLIDDPVELAKREASNALDQFDWAMEEVERWIAAGKPNLRVSTLLKLHRLAMDGIDQYAGNFRPAGVAIKGSKHFPVSRDDVPRYVEEMLEYVSDNWSEETAIHLSSYVMWRLNWIHPFADGNGRTSRILSYMVLC
ncbi:MAG: Fic family protein, partial [Paracoccaceae bacterium]|nr:Fic family protein [Paracoccaceae bacterium]